MPAFPYKRLQSKLSLYSTYIIHAHVCEQSKFNNKWIHFSIVDYHLLKLVKATSLPVSSWITVQFRYPT